MEISLRLVHISCSDDDNSTETIMEIEDRQKIKEFIMENIIEEDYEDLLPDAYFSILMEGVEVGYIRTYIIPYYRRFINDDELYLADMVSSSFYNAMCEFEEFGKDKYDTIYFIEELFVNEDCRRKGIGSKAIELLISLFKDLEIENSCLYLEAGKVDCDEFWTAAKNKAYTSMLIDFYGRNGFRIAKESYMIRDL